MTKRCEHKIRPVKDSRPPHIFCKRCGHSWPATITQSWARLVSIEDVEDGNVAWRDPDVVGIYDRDGRRLTWDDLKEPVA